MMIKMIMEKQKEAIDNLKKTLKAELKERDEEKEEQMERRW